MTTPALDIYKNQYVDCTTTTVRKSDGVTVGTVTGQGSIRQIADKRPASTSSPLIRGWRQPRPWSHTAWKFDISQGTSRQEDFPTPGYISLFNGVRWSATPVTPLTNPMAVVPSLRKRAETAALLKLKGKKLDLGVLIGERRETARMFVSACEGAANIYRSFRKLNPREWAKVLKTNVARGEHWPDAWLTAQLGVRPFINDLSAAADIANQGGMARPPIVTVKGSAKDSVMLESYASSVTGNFYMLMADETTSKVFVRLDYEQSSPLEASLASLGLTNPFSIAWELLPYSFVVDYLIGIGDYISTWDAAFGWNFLAGSRSELVNVKRKGHAVPKPNIDGYCPDKVNGRAVWFNRYVYSTSPLPSGPVFKDPFSYTHVATLASLVSAALSRSK